MLDGCTPWPEDFARHYRERGLWRPQSLFERLADSVAAAPGRVAIVEGAQRVGYAELLARTEALAAGLQRLGLKPLDRVVFQLANGIAGVEALFALARIGAIPVMALPAHRRHDIVHFARAAGAVALMIPDEVRGFDYRTMAREVTTEVPGLHVVIVDGSPGPAQHGLRELAVAGAAPTQVMPAAGEVALMLLSGGTTGMPKLIPRTHADYLCGCLHAARVAGFGPRTVFLAVLPIAHNYTLGAPGVVGALCSGARVVIAPATSPEAVLPLIGREGVTVVSAAAPLIARWLASPELGRCDFSALEVLMCGGSKLAPELRRRVEQRLGCTYQESYGTAEGLLNMTRLDDPEPLRLHSSGRPVCEADEIRIVDPDGRELPDGQAGELQVRGPYTIRGYYRNTEADARAFTADGYYRMGDIARRVDGYLHLEGRLKELINRGGEKISCEEIENHLLAHPVVESACVVAVPDAVYGEKACAVIVPRAGETLSLAELTGFLHTRDIARFKWPEQLVLVDEFPVSPAGKVLRRELQARIAAGEGASR